MEYKNPLIIESFIWRSGLTLIHEQSYFEPEDCSGSICIRLENKVFEDIYSTLTTLWDMKKEILRTHQITFEGTEITKVPDPSSSFRSHTIDCINILFTIWNVDSKNIFPKYDVEHHDVPNTYDYLVTIKGHTFVLAAPNEKNALYRAVEHAKIKNLEVFAPDDAYTKAPFSVKLINGKIIWNKDVNIQEVPCLN